MTNKKSNIELDSIDLKIVECLMVQGRMTWAELAEKLKLSPPSTADRVRRLEEAGVILGYAAMVNPEALNCALEALVFVTLDNPDSRGPFLATVKNEAHILECYHLAGDDDYFLKIRCQGTRELEHLLSEVLKGIKGVIRTRTVIVLSAVKESTCLPIPAA